MVPDLGLQEGWLLLLDVPFANSYLPVISDSTILLEEMKRRARYYMKVELGPKMYLFPAIVVVHARALT